VPDGIAPVVSDVENGKPPSRYNYLMMHVRHATVEDAGAITRIYNQGIDERTATFETEPRTEVHVRAWFERTHPIVVVEHENTVIAFAAGQPSSTRSCYARNAEFSVYVERAARGKGAGQLAMRMLADILRDMGFNKLVSHVFADNQSSLEMLRVIGFREVGTLMRHGELEGRWRDVVVVEMLL
jgi:L-amino acid N-acyltransferase YncA